MKKIVFIIFVVVCLIQIAVPSKMIMDKEEILSVGHMYKFRTAPVDPYDPFRGKYVTLTFDARNVTAGDDSVWNTGESVYVLLGTDTAGYAMVQDIMHVSPSEENVNVDYVTGVVKYAYGKEVTIEYPFERFYMDENKAPEAEKQFNEANQRNNTEQEAYAVVYVKNGEAALKDVMIDGVSLRDLTEKK